MTLTTVISTMRRTGSTGDHHHQTGAAATATGGGGSKSSSRLHHHHHHRRHSKQHSHGNIAGGALVHHINQSDDDDELTAPPIITTTASPSPSTPPKKVWEKSYHRFLALHRRGTGTGGGGRNTSSSSASSNSSSGAQSQQQQPPPAPPPPPQSTGSTPPTFLVETSTSSYNSHNSQQAQEQQQHAPQQQQQQQQQQKSPSSSLLTPKGLLSRKKTSARHAVKQQQHQQQSSQAQQPPSMPAPPPSPSSLSDPSDSSVRGGNFFSQVFRGGGSGTPNSKSRKVKSISSDELDGTMRRGVTKSYNNINTAALATQQQSPRAAAAAARRRATSTGATTATNTSSPRQRTHSAGGSTAIAAVLHQPQHAHAYKSPGGTTTRRSASLSTDNIVQNFSNAASSHTTALQPRPEHHHHQEGIEEPDDDDDDDNNVGFLLDCLELPLTSRTTSAASFLAGRTFLPPANNSSSHNNNAHHQYSGQNAIVRVGEEEAATATATTTTTTTTPQQKFRPVVMTETRGEKQQEEDDDADELDKQLKRGCSSSPSSIALQPGTTATTMTTSAMKKAFTDFHNSQTTGHDGGSAYLKVDDNNDSSFHNGEQLFWAAIPPRLPTVVSHSSLEHEATQAVAALHQSNNCLERVPEHTSNNHYNNKDASSSLLLLSSSQHNQQQRILRPLTRVDQWQSGRRYLIAPAVLSACPTSVWQALGGVNSSSLSSSLSSSSSSPNNAPSHLSAQQAAAEISKNARYGMFQRVVLGDCLVSHGVLGAATGSSTTQPSRIAAQWSPAFLVLQQNYLFEFAQGTFSNDNNKETVVAATASSVGGGAATAALAAATQMSTTQTQQQPRGFAHLEFSQTYAQDDFCDALELQYYASPCAKKDLRVVLIRLSQKSAKERDAWKVCLNRAASLQMEDLYSILTREEFEKEDQHRQRYTNNAIGAASSHYHFDEDGDRVILGKGQYSAVYPARRKDNTGNQSTMVALKVLEKNAFWKLVVKGRERADTLVRETSVQATLSAKCAQLNSFSRLRGLFESATHVVLELEYLQGTVDLFQYISSKGVLSEPEAARILADILQSLAAMSQIGLAHRDIKPANVLMCSTLSSDDCKSKSSSEESSSSSSFPRVKVCDFGMSTFVGVDGKVRGRCGTPGYVAPEIFTAGIHGGYSNQVDVFSAGVTLYVMLCGYEPFYGETDAELVETNRQAKVEFPPDEWSGISNLAQDLVRQMMEPDPERRPSAKQALKHPWFQSHGVDVVVPVFRNSITQLQQQQHDDSSPHESACAIS